MENRVTGVLGIVLVLAAGCTDDGRRLPWSEPPPDDGVAGVAGSALASGGEGGSADGAAGTSGTGGAVDAAPTAACEADKPSTSAADAALPTMDTDGGIASSVTSPNDDGGVDPDPDPIVFDPTGDSGTVMPNVPTTPSLHGEVIVTELMLDPTLVADTVGEWIELHNTTAADLDLGGCVVSDDRTDDFALAPVVVPAGGFIVLGRTAEAASVVDQVYSGMVLANTADEVVITCGNVLIDRVAYGTGYPRRAGRTMQLSSATFDGDSNDLSSSWCDGNDIGTPGAANVACAIE